MGEIKKPSPNLYIIAGPNGAGKTQNLFTRYRPVLDSWMLFDNSGTAPRLIAREELGALRVFDHRITLGPAIQ